MNLLSPKFAVYWVYAQTDRQTKCFSGKDYVNFIVKDIARPDLPEADNVDRRTTPR